MLKAKIAAVTIFLAIMTYAGLYLAIVAVGIVG